MSVAGDEGSGLEAAAGDELERLAANGRRVMEGCTQRDVAIVDAIGIESDVGVGCASAEEIDCAALADKLDRLLPRFGSADSLNGDVDAAISGRESAGFANCLADCCSLHNMRRAKLTRCFNLAVVLDDGDGFKAGERGDVQNHEAQRAAADDGDNVALARTESSSPCTAQASGSVRAACSSGTFAGMTKVFFETMRSGILMNSA